MKDEAAMTRQCKHSHERWRLVSRHYPNARIWILSCAHCGWVDTEAAIEAAEALTSSGRFLMRLASEGGAIVSSGCAHEIEIADARARGDFLVIDALGFILRSKQWRDRAEKALHEKVERGDDL